MSSKPSSNRASPPRKRVPMQPALPLILTTPADSPSGAAAATPAVYDASQPFLASNPSDLTSTMKTEAIVTPPNDSIMVEQATAENSYQIVQLGRSHSVGHLETLRDLGDMPTPKVAKSAEDLVQFGSVEDPFLDLEQDRTPSASDESMDVAMVDVLHATQKSAPQTSVSQESPDAAKDFSPREDRLGEPITPANAQGRLPPEACVFVANLSNTRSREQLEKSVQDTFEKYGKCYTKIRYDRNQMPFAFVQYESKYDARVAIEKGNHQNVDGRKVRTEGARGTRAVYLTRTTGGAISTEEALAVLGCYGAIEETCATTIADQVQYNLPEGIWVKFHYVLDCQDAVAGIRKENTSFRLLPQSSEVSRGLQLSNVTPTPPGGIARANRQYQNGRSVFVGDLPASTTEAMLFQLFSQFGRVAAANVLHREFAGKANTFGFVSFYTPQEAHAALTGQVQLGGVPLRVEAKRPMMPRMPRHGSSPLASSHSSTPTSQYDAIFYTLYQQGLEMGLPAEQASRLLSLRNGHPAVAAAGHVHPIHQQLPHALPPQYGPHPAMMAPQLAMQQPSYASPPYSSPAGTHATHHSHHRHTNPNEMSPTPMYYGSNTGGASMSVGPVPAGAPFYGGQLPPQHLQQQHHVANPQQQYMGAGGTFGNYSGTMPSIAEQNEGGYMGGWGN